MEYNISLPQGLNYYFTILSVFLAAYWLAYIFKNLSNLFDRQGIIRFIVLMSLFFGVFVVFGQAPEQMEDYWITGAYLSGFLIRFFRYDS